MNETDLQLRLDRETVLHFLYPQGYTPRPRIDHMLSEVLPEARTLVAACGGYVRLPVERAPEVGLTPIDADALVIGLVTAGPAIEARVRQLTEVDEITRALLMDAAGSAAAEEAADQLGAQIVGDDEADLGNGVSCRLSPGYGAWKITSQPALFALLPHEKLGVTLTSSHMMVPRKSISFAMWLGARGRIGAGVAGCARCTLEHCRYRRQPCQTKVTP